MIKHLFYIIAIFHSLITYAQPLTPDLECVSIPNNTYQICTLESYSAFGPYDDVVFYRLEEKRYLYLLGLSYGDNMTFGGFSFSDGGKYMWVSWAEEGHSSFVFYETADFLQQAENAKSLYYINGYGLSEFLSFSDDAKVKFSRDYNQTDDFRDNPRTYEVFLLKE